MSDYAYIRVSTKEQNVDRWFVALKADNHITSFNRMTIDKKFIFLLFRLQSYGIMSSPRKSNIVRQTQGIIWFLQQLSVL